MVKKTLNTIIIIFGILLVMFILLFIGVNYIPYSFQILKQSNTIGLELYNVSISQDIKDYLNTLDLQSGEKAFCLIGNINGKNINIIELKEISGESSKENFNVSNESECSGYIGGLHTHPKYLGISNCAMSKKDKEAFNYQAVKFNQKLFIIYCGKDKYSYFEFE